METIDPFKINNTGLLQNIYQRFQLRLEGLMMSTIANMMSIS